jgi:hypothetical protein
MAKHRLHAARGGIVYEDVEASKISHGRGHESINVRRDADVAFHCQASRAEPLDSFACFFPLAGGSKILELPGEQLNSVTAQRQNTNVRPFFSET